MKEITFKNITYKVLSPKEKHVLNIELKKHQYSNGHYNSLFFSALDIAQRQRLVIELYAITSELCPAVLDAMPDKNFFENESKDINELLSCCYSLIQEYTKYINSITSFEFLVPETKEEKK